MNIFFLDENPEACAKLHCDKHVVKMIVETAQLLSAAHHILDQDLYPDFKRYIYRPSHLHHPCVHWTVKKSSNYSWLYKLFLALGNEYTYRYNKLHKSIDKLKDVLIWLPDNIALTDESYDELPLCMPDECKVMNSNRSAVVSYQNYYRYKKDIMTMKWTNREVPDWFT